MPRRLGTKTATLVVMASMIGTGVFTTSGLLISELGSANTVLLAWLVGGVIALTGALSYAELTACITRNGGEYRLLSEVYHPLVGFVAGWVSLVVGFSAPIAASALAFASYAHALAPALPITATALFLVLVLSVGHAAHTTIGVKFQNGLALATLVLIVAFLLGALFNLSPSPGAHLAQRNDGVLSSRFAVALIMVSFAYAGWNGAAYVAGEVREPARTLPRALGAGTTIVVLLYLALNYVFLASAPLEKLAGKVEIAHIAAVNLFGGRGGQLLSALIALALVSFVSVMIFVGPRVYEAMGEDHPLLHSLGKRPTGAGPVFSIGVQAVIATALILTVRFDALLMYIGYTLSVSAALTVLGVFVYRFRKPKVPRPYKTFGYPVTPALFIVFAVWSIVYSIEQRPSGAWLGLMTIALGIALYFGVTRWDARRAAPRTEGTDL